MSTNQKQSILSFTPREKKDLVISWVTLSIAFALVIRWAYQMDIFTALLTSLIAVGSGFVLHELAHREAAKHYGFHSEFRAWYPGLALALALAFISGGQFTFAAPGATYFYATNVSTRQNGVISAAGPTLNIILGVILLILGAALAKTIFGMVLLAASSVNFWLAFFNLLPIYPLDGSKIVKWRAGYWVLLIAASGFLVFGLGPLGI